jgi:hypothetical protein
MYQQRHVQAYHPVCAQDPAPLATGTSQESHFFECRSRKILSLLEH